jgi:hypothetical protein
MQRLQPWIVRRVIRQEVEEKNKNWKLGVFFI